MRVFNAHEVMRLAKICLASLPILLGGCDSAVPSASIAVTLPSTIESGANRLLASNAYRGELGRKRDVRTPAVLAEERAAKRELTASSLNRLALAYVNAKDGRRAAATYYKEALVFAHRGDTNTALALLRSAQQYESQAQIFDTEPSLESHLGWDYTGARLEPKYGCYTGAFIDHETSLPGKMLDGDPRRSVAAFNQRTGVHHASYFIYLGYGRPFPKQWVADLKANGAVGQIAFEPSSYEQVKDDDYLRNFARAAKSSGVPIFLRFASEMNGDWVVYHKSPRKYIAMFQLVAKVMHEEAPNVAMVWCPFEIPQRLITPYYPGKEAVDWVGVNIYAVLYNDNDPTRNAQSRNPADALKFIYNRYSKDHPIMIGEFGAANMSSLDMVPRSDYAITKLRQFYCSLPRLFPRVKAVHWLSMNAIKHALPGRQLNNYSLLDDMDVTEAYQEVNSNPYFLKEYAPEAVAPEMTLPLQSNRHVSGHVRLSGWVKTTTNQPTIIWIINGQERARLTMPGDYAYNWSTSDVPNGRATVELVVVDRDGYEVLRKRTRVTVENGNHSGKVF